jgi:hypothetical protein
MLLYQACLLALGHFVDMGFYTKYTSWGSKRLFLPYLFVSFNDVDSRFQAFEPTSYLTNKY